MENQIELALFFEDLNPKGIHAYRKIIALWTFDPDGVALLLRLITINI
jgi:hypothetical protein